VVTETAPDYFEVLGRVVLDSHGGQIVYDDGPDTLPSPGAAGLQREALKDAVGEPGAGWPRMGENSFTARLEWRRGIMGTGIGASGLHVADIDGDAMNEIITGASSGGFSPNRFWYVLVPGAAGYAQAWVSPLYEQTLTAIRVAEINGLPGKEVVVGVGTEILVYDGATKVVLTTITTSATSVHGLRVVDVDSDGQLEFVFTDGSNVYVYSMSGVQEGMAGGYGGSDLDVGNVDDDPALEIAVSATPGYVLNGQTLAVEWTYPSGFGSYMRVGDIDGDTRGELVAGWGWYKITAYDGDLQSPKWEIPVDLDLDALQLADVEPDGSLDVVYGDGQWGAVYVHDGATGAYKWSINNPEHGVTDIALGDSDNDGVNEILWGAGFSSTGPDYLFVHDTATLSREWQSSDINGPFYAMDYGDVDDDGDPEILYGCISSDSGYGDGLWFVHDAVTKALEYESGEPTGSDWMGLWRIRHGNIDADPQHEIFVSTSRTYTGYIKAYDGITHKEQWEAQVVSSGQGFVSMDVADVDSDGTLEVVAAVDKAHTGSPGEYLYVFNGATGAEEWRSVSLGSGWPTLSLLRVGDVDADDNLEMIVAQYGGRLYVYDGVTHVEETQSFDLDISALDLADVDGDDTLDIVIGSTSGALYVIDSDTGAITNTIGNYGGRIDGLSVVDVNFDMVPDYIFAVSDELHIYNGADPTAVLWASGEIGSYVGQHDSIMTGDFDDDGNLEIMVNLGSMGLAMYEVGFLFPDCNGNGIPDDDDITGGTSQDCNTNLLPDECDLEAGTSYDVNANGIPDECEDCNGNGMPDDSENPVILFRNLGQEVGLLSAVAGVAQDIHLGGVGEAYLRRLEVHYRSTGSTPGNMFVRLYANDLLDHTAPPNAGLIAEYAVGTLQPTTFDFGIASFDIDPDLTIPHNLWTEVELDGDAGIVLRTGPTDAGHTHGLVYDNSAGGIQPGDTLLALRLDGVLCPSDCNANETDDAEEADSDGDLLIDDCDECPTDPLVITVSDETPAAETCEDGIDNDCDGNTDSADADCTVPGCVCGDINGSGGLVDRDDFATFVTCFTLDFPALNCDAAEFACCDMTGNGRVDLDDFATFAVMFATAPTVTVPNCTP
jgi:hypothetical protein